MKRTYLAALLLSLTLLVGLGAPALTFAAASSPIVPDCDPSLPPYVHKGDTFKVNVPDPNDPTETIVQDVVAENNACGVSSFIQLIQNIIKWLTVIIIPIIVLLIGYAGFMILTSGGSEERLGQGWKIIKTALIGLVIISVAYIVVQFVFNALGVTSEFRPTGLK